MTNQSSSSEQNSWDKVQLTVGWHWEQDEQNNWIAVYDTDPIQYSPDPVNHPPHYNSHPSGIKCIQITRHMNFNLGNAIKYVWRADLKSDDPVEDLRKAIWYLQDEITRLEGTT